MAHDLHYFINEVGRVRTTAINRGWTAPANIDAQVYLRSSDDPREVDVEAWAAALSYIETRHRIPLTISGGGYGCFAVAASCKLDDATRLIAAVEDDFALQGYLARSPPDQGRRGLATYREKFKFGDAGSKMAAVLHFCDQSKAVTTVAFGRSN